MTVFTYGNHTIDSGKLPQSSLDAMLKRGLAHYLGNEQASKVTSHFDGETPSDEAKAAYKAECVAKAIQALNDGTVGVSTRGPRLDPVETYITRIAKAAVTDILKTQKGPDGKPCRFPKDGEVVTFANGETRTGPAMIAKWLAGNDPDGKPRAERVKREADKMLADAKRKAEKAAKTAVESGAEAIL